MRNSTTNWPNCLIDPSKDVIKTMQICNTQLLFTSSRKDDAVRLKPSFHMIAHDRRNAGMTDALRSLTIAINFNTCFNYIAEVNAPMRSSTVRGPFGSQQVL